ncbi:peptide/nickel transport system ATP-binding protein [Tindallia magadiensis]|uniref:Peptide/nickel transport system ATP-binding protein n=1 Tax=Tindallia magadiensis TaxID=69895 RepID=A0A1I3GSV7_9FIRM|nr:oligopeptide/dipeptide ABC transporter ATP-binding protein [Tindallia magadiensis]SFI26479.1 peptide/nickel transport system ATP-binding protein [Tindallia magadiensis]
MTKNILEVKNLKKYFKTPKGMLHAVDDVSFFIKEGETLGLVGESGCGKSTTGRAILRLVEPTSGEVNFEGKNIVGFNGAQMREARKNMQIIFQDPYASLNPRMNLGQIISEPLLINKVFKDRKKVTDRVKELMDTVGLTPRLLNAFPHELDGGRRQRVGVARALALNPKFIVQDEPVSALDVSIQAQILNLMQDIQDEWGLTYLFISHDLSVVKHVSDRIAVMYLGKVVELSEYNAIFKNPLHPYTQALLSAIPVPRVDAPDNMIILEGDVPSPINPPEGCRFYGRCRYRQDICKTKTPELREYEPERFVACHLVEELQR